ncbi:AIPR family protein [Pseudoalteromonas sp. SR41-4]|uniref:AIPR family protein n=1 Tax=Pseudoalteromonas sp. SR41-4 TaxID=2760950 RepID=UPI0016046100|nr:AIPR family protein [Pseudoalteromonas sp. SR41-4]MBB1295650.1 AIPR family protein [Pseudoalteromonas sp. SR41-4]
MSLELFYTNFMQEIYSEAEVGSKFNEPVFVEKVCDYLVEQAVMENYNLCSHKKDSLGLKLDAWHRNEQNGVLTLIVSHYKDKLETLTTSLAMQISKRAVRFFDKSLDNNFYQTMEETDLAYPLVRDICLKSSEITSIRIIIITNSELSKSIKSIPSVDSNNGIKINFDIWDIERIYRIDSSKAGKESIEIDFKEEFGNYLPCLKAFSQTDEYQSYLLVLPGSLLSKLYDKYTERLLEQNVRTFLQFKGKVNKGMRNTIINEPNMFFAFNNGLTATAEEIAIYEENGNTMISKLKNLQIVNGGQTTASIYNTLKKEKADLTQVFIQVKLTIVPPESVETIVPKISEFANTQNKVNAADFFSNSPFHWRFEELSRRIWAPSSEGGLQETHWFYERARGQYMTAKTKLTPAEQKKFEKINPKPQMLTKTDLAKFYNSWEKMPHVVSLGAQKNFGKFAEIMTEQWNKDDKPFNELFFKESIAKAILFKELDKKIMKQSWYGGYKANIVTYTISKFRHMIDGKSKLFNLMEIWNSQSLPAELLDNLLEIAAKVNEVIKDTPQHVTNISEWCKKPDCWENLINTYVPLSSTIESMLIDPSVAKEQKKEAATVQSIDNGIEAQKYVFDKTEQYWKKMQDWNKASFVLSHKEKSILDIAAAIPTKIPTEKQCLSLLDVEKKALEEGFHFV